MALSSSIKRAQNPKLCELCKTAINIKWKCVECNKFICDRCKEIHLNVQTNIQHQIIDICGNLRNQIDLPGEIVT